jgi:hypothetical protein
VLRPLTAHLLVRGAQIHTSNIYFQRPSQNCHLETDAFIHRQEPYLPTIQSCKWSEIAFAADMADESLRAAMTAAPLC